MLYLIWKGCKVLYKFALAIVCVLWNYLSVCFFRIIATHSIISTDSNKLTNSCRLIAKYRPTMPVLSVVIPRLKTNQLRWTFSGAFEVLPNGGIFHLLLVLRIGSLHYSFCKISWRFFFIFFLFSFPFHLLADTCLMNLCYFLLDLNG